MSKRWIGLLTCAPVAFVLALSCGNSDKASSSSCSTSGGSGGLGGGASGGSAGSSAGAGGRSGTEDSAGAAGTPAVVAEGGAAGAAGGAGGDDNGGAGGSAGGEVTLPLLTPAGLPDLAFWLDGNSDAYSDLDSNALSSPPYGWVRTVPETAPLTGIWGALMSTQRPVREVGAFSLKPVDTYTGYYLQDSAGTIQTDNCTLLFSFRPLNGVGGPAQGGLAGQIGASPQDLGISIGGGGVGLYFNHASTALTRLIPRGAHVSMIVRFTSTGANVQYDINGVRTSESVAATIPSETASKFIVGYDAANNASIYGYVSQVVGVNRAVSDTEEAGLMNWLTAQPIPDAFPVTKPLVAILGDSIANGDQVSGWESWGFRMLSDLNQTNPDVQLLNAASNGSGVPKVRGSDYSDYVLPWYSAARAKNILILAAGTNDLANGVDLSDLLTRYYALLDSARTTGWKTVACTVLPRSNADIAVGEAAFESTRQAFNADILANWASHADGLANVAAIAGMGAAGDSNNATNYTIDKIHPTAVGYGLLEPVYLAPVASLLK